LKTPSPLIPLRENFVNSEDADPRRPHPNFLILV
jgi:hypothetical protein